MPVETPFDYNGDNISDVVWFNFVTGQEQIWNMANNQLLVQQNVAAELNVPLSVFPPFTPRSGDFNGDNTTDLFYFNFVTGQSQNYLFQNDQVVQVVALPTTNPALGWFPVADGDYNGNGTSDILWHNFTTNQNTIWLMGSNGQFVSQTSLPPTTINWFAAAGGSPLSGDYNGDGTTDLLWRDQGAGTNIIWNLSGGQFASQTVLPAATSSWWLYGTGDFNADGTSDLLWHNTATTANQIWQINNSQLIATSNLPATTNDWVARVGTYDSDATSEIFWHRQSATGENIVWNISNLQFAGQTVNPNALFPPWQFPDAIGPFAFLIDV
jgi:FG-GAP-like repeat